MTLLHSFEAEYEDETYIIEIHREWDPERHTEVYRAGPTLDRR